MQQWGRVGRPFGVVNVLWQAAVSIAWWSYRLPPTCGLEALDCCSKDWCCCLMGGQFVFWVRVTTSAYSRNSHFFTACLASSGHFNFMSLGFERHREVFTPLEWEWHFKKAFFSLTVVTDVTYDLFLTARASQRWWLGIFGSHEMIYSLLTAGRWRLDTVGKQITDTTDTLHQALVLTLLNPLKEMKKKTYPVLHQITNTQNMCTPTHKAKAVLPSLLCLSNS